MDTPTTTTAATPPAADTDAQLRQAETPHGLADLADTAPAELADAGEAGAVVLLGPDTPAETPDRDSLAAAKLSRPAAADRGDATPAEKKAHTCSWCHRSFRSGPALGGHKKNCKQRPPGGVKAEKKAEKEGRPAPAPAAEPINIGDAYRAAPRRAAAPRAAAPAGADAAAAAAREAVAAGAVDFDAAGGGVVGMAALVGRLSSGNIGVPELSALACETALPPPLRPAEYAALVAVWGDDDLDLPPGVIKAFVTGSIFLPRLLEHPTLGPQLRQLGSRLFGRFTAAPEPPPVYAPPPPPPRPVPDPEPEPQPADEPPPRPAASWNV